MNVQVDPIEVDDLQADQDAVMSQLLTGKPLDLEIARRVHVRAQRIREEIRQRCGIVDFAVPTIRELRGELRP